MKSLSQRYADAKVLDTDGAWREFVDDVPSRTARVVMTESGMSVFYRRSDGGVVIVPVHDFIDARTK